MRQRWNAETYKTSYCQVREGRALVKVASLHELPVYSVGDVMYQPLWTSDQRPDLDPPDRKLLTGPNSVEFTSKDGKRARAEW